MKIALYSDLHRELSAFRSDIWEPPELDVDLTILAGDISSHTRGLLWASSAFEQPVIYVAGNHEYYDAHLGLLDEMQKPVWEQAGVHFLERRCIELNGVRFLGCTLWSGFDLHGADKAGAYMDVAKRRLNDFWMIHARGGKRLEPRDTQKLHRTAVRWLDAELSKPYDGKTVVVTHFAPHPGCVAPEHQGSDVSPYFVSDLSRLMKKHKIDLWCHGHTHTNTDFMAENGCRVISNQLGYQGERSRTQGGITFDNGFRNNLVIDLDDPTSSRSAPDLPRKSPDVPMVAPRADGYVYRDDIPQPWRGKFMRALRSSHQTRQLVPDRPIDNCFFASEWQDWIATK